MRDTSCSKKRDVPVLLPSECAGTPREAGSRAGCDDDHCSKKTFQRYLSGECQPLREAETRDDGPATKRDVPAGYSCREE
ncbi:hypothetical protein AVEN_182246-1 [Araneus ventricosus]|uniref:Uncharacterized protein n=1 Tax=Araneus ventricosus TaxID=182803 RepID=A0A4Y2UA41_ARAVE|nr:hypothetical protein AVEN_182246-1 [Araneus ventricosus]